MSPTSAGVAVGPFSVVSVLLQPEGQSYPDVGGGGKVGAGFP